MKIFYQRKCPELRYIGIVHPGSAFEVSTTSIQVHRNFTLCTYMFVQQSSAFSHIGLHTYVKRVMSRFAINCPTDVPSGHVYKTCSW